MNYGSCFVSADTIQPGIQQDTGLNPIELSSVNQLINQSINQSIYYVKAWDEVALHIRAEAHV